MSFGDRIMQLRNKRNMTQKDLANVLKISRGAVSMWEIGQRTPDPPMLQKLATYFGVSVDYLLGHPPSDPSTPPWWDRDTPPSPVELEEFLKKANVQFDGAPLDEEDKEDIMTYLSVKWEREKRKREKDNK